MKITPRQLFCLALALPGGIELHAQSPVWSLLTLPVSPSSRTSVAMAHDAAHQQLVLFGGKTGTGTPLADTWLWNGTGWSAAQPSTSPSARFEHAMAYDEARQRVVVFGGMTATGELDDLWEWDGVSWTQVTTSPRPAPRSGHAMVYDAARQRIVLFGGGSAGSFAADTWEWDGTNWTLRAPAASPSARAQHAMAYDPLRQRTVLSGGHFGSAIRTDVWEWDGTNWSQVTALPTAAGMLPGRLGHAMCWHPPSQQVLMSAGYGASTGIGWTDLFDTWGWDGSNWSSLTTNGPPVFDHAIAFDPIADGVVLFGGRRVLTWTSLQLTYLFEGAFASATTYGAGCGTPPLALAPVAGAARPILGSTVKAAVTNAPTPLVAVAFGSSNQSSVGLPLPLSLSPFGMTGCSLWHTFDIGTLATVATGNGYEIAIAVPSSTSLLGGHLYLQGFGEAPGQNPAQIITSNGIDWQFGV